MSVQINKMMKFILIILSLLFIGVNSSLFAISGSLSSLCTPQDTIKSKLSSFLNFNDSLFRFQYNSLPQTALNANRIVRLSFHGDNKNEYIINSSIQKYFTEISQEQNYNLLRGYETLIFNLAQNNKSNLGNITAQYVAGLQKREILFSVWRNNLLNAETEDEALQNIKESTRTMIRLGYAQAEYDLFPFITMLMWEQRKYHYDKKRIVATNFNAKGVVSSIQILQALKSLDKTIVAGVCRDVHDMGLRLLRPMLEEYFAYKYSDKDYNVDDYLFLQAWVTPSSQHITIAAVDPENPRNYFELDWGSVLKKENQEGVEIGKMIGTTVRLWQYNPNKNITQAFNLIRTQWGTYFDKHFFKKDEDWLFNGIYTPNYFSSSDYIISAGKKSEINLSLAMLNAGEKSFSTSYRSGVHRFSFGGVFKYSGFVGLQTMIIDDTQRKNFTMAWNEWYSSVNWSNSIRYLPEIKTKDLYLFPNFKMYLYGISQIEFFLSLSHFKCNDPEFNDKFNKSGDGNIWLTWGGALNYVHNNFSFDAKFSSRNFLITTDVRLLSPNPFELIRNATVANSGIGFLIRGGFDNKNWQIQPEFRFEQNKINAKFIFASLKIGKLIGKNNRFIMETGNYNQIKEIEYYWYAKSRYWINAGISSLKKKFNISLRSELIKEDFLSIGIQFNKYLN